jgi:hypothetical protein
MDSGKSTLVAVLTHGSDGRPLLDNCRGSARMAVFRHKHEIESGRTSSISQQVRHSVKTCRNGGVAVSSKALVLEGHPGVAHIDICCHGCLCFCVYVRMSLSI